MTIFGNLPYLGFTTENLQVKLIFNKPLSCLTQTHSRLIQVFGLKGLATATIKRIVQSKIYFWYLKEEQNLSILVKVAPNSHVPFLRYWQLKFPHFLPKWTWSKQMWCHGCTMAKVCFVILYILLCCFYLELDTVASLPAGNLKSM